MVYVVEATVETMEFLNKEGYKILHRPYFALKGFTHFYWTIDTEDKSAVDYAKDGKDALTFEEFMKEINNG